MKACTSLKIKSHPARFPSKLPEFFIKYLTDENDLVLDIFSGSNTTGEVAERLNRRWLAFDNELEYIANSSLRFLNTSAEHMNEVYQKINNGQSLDLTKYNPQTKLFPTTVPIVE